MRMNGLPDVSGSRIAGHLFAGVLAGVAAGLLAVALMIPFPVEDADIVRRGMIFIYFAVWGFAVGMISAFAMGGVATRWKRALYWAGFWHAVVVTFILGGALAGGVLFVVVGSIAGMEAGIGDLFRSGLWNGGFYLLIWAPGIAIILCVIRARNAAVEP